MYIAGSSDKAIKGFFIRKEVVTIAEYMQFWKKLPEKTKKRRMIWFFSKDEAKSTALWNSKLQISHPYSGNDPVFGLSRSDADAYCSFLSRQKNRKVRLPSAKEWKRAAFSFASGKISAYGVSGLNRNIRELLASEKNGTGTVNVGFRYIMDMSAND